tara:strand:- start:1089 stop:1949 length:861 start_codon:yes stop_codon:yes gene_type:complete
MNILITGASSALGQFFIKESLQIFPQARILALSRTKLHIASSRVECLRHNLEKDRFKRSEKFDFVIHAASIVPNKARNDEDFIRINCDGSLRLFKEIIFNRSASILNISSSSVYHEPASPTLTENSLKTKDDPYGISKLKFESMLVNHFRGLDLNILTCRIPVLLVKNVQNNFLADWVAALSNNNKIKLFNPDDLFNACVSAKDIFQFFINFSQQYEKKNLICNLSSSHPISIQELALHIMECFGKKTGVIVQESAEPSQLISNQLAIDHGFKPSSVVDSIKSIFE